MGAHVVLFIRIVGTSKDDMEVGINEVAGHFLGWKFAPANQD